MTGWARCAVGVPNVGAFGDPLLLVELAVAAEEHGWDGFFLWDHQLYHDHRVGDLPALVVVQLVIPQEEPVPAVLLRRHGQLDQQQRIAKRADVRHSHRAAHPPRHSVTLGAYPASLVSPASAQARSSTWVMISGGCAPETP